MEQDSFEVDSVISATGFTNDSPCGQENDETHWLGHNVFKVGWLNRDGKGTIADNRKDAKNVTDFIFTIFEDGQLSASKIGFEAISSYLKKPIVDFLGWKKIDSYERSFAAENRCRKKITDVEKMLAIAHDNKYQQLSPLNASVSNTAVEIISI
ncbi:hypothetical protein D3C84_824560 [compost metagenome]